MKLGALIDGADYTIDGSLDTDVTGICYDSRRVARGDIFFALARDPERNQNNIEEAFSRGARAVVVRKWSGASRPAVPPIECEQPRRLMALAAARFFDRPSRRLELIGVTGTSGKTTSTYLLASIFEAAGETPGVIGTLGIRIGSRHIPTELTTPESVDFESALAEMAGAGVRHAAAEISSIGLSEGRVDELDFRACLFTNLGRDHLDYHVSVDSYFAAKLRLFTELLAASRHPDPVAVALNDDLYGKRTLESVGCRKLSFGIEPGADVFPRRYELGLEGIRATLQLPGRVIELDSPLLGKFNLLNILGAVAVSVALGIDEGAVVEGVRRCPGAAGRLEVVARPRGAVVMVDYAHKPDALKAVLEALRKLNPKRLICIFGCGGDRDRGKRPIMGKIAAQLADLPLLTSDNPRTEDPLKIIAEVEAGLIDAGLKRGVGYLVEPDRRAAIGLALSIAAAGDIIVIAGKGHEDYQIIGTRKFHFDDREVVRDFFQNLQEDSGA
ncbi:MAG TPA: UDP-N-acetylmuramoyl-L-alanyl-D-glutamate--2,6-diaminopimelate ligase [Candidatus Binataceae bacterium]